jgi:hypothetical protein
MALISALKSRVSRSEAIQHVYIKYKTNMITISREDVISGKFIAIIDKM